MQPEVRAAAAVAAAVMMAPLTVPDSNHGGRSFHYHDAGDDSLTISRPSCISSSRRQARTMGAAAAADDGRDISGHVPRAL